MSEEESAGGTSIYPVIHSVNSKNTLSTHYRPIPIQFQEIHKKIRQSLCFQGVHNISGKISSYKLSTRQRDTDIIKVGVGGRDREINFVWQKIGMSWSPQTFQKEGPESLDKVAPEAGILLL